MAELEIASGKNRNRKFLHGQKKLSTKVDLTPMVDLGFLLITFFMVTTAWAKPHTIRLILPADGNSTLIGDKEVITILAGKENKIFYYCGTFENSANKKLSGITNYSIQNGVGDVIRRKQSEMDNLGKSKRNDLVVIIKPSKDASYENVVSLLDEMLINRVLKYALVDMTEFEQKLLDEKIP